MPDACVSQCVVLQKFDEDLGDAAVGPGSSAKSHAVVAWPFCL